MASIEIREIAVTTLFQSGLPSAVHTQPHSKGSTCNNSSCVRFSFPRRILNILFLYVIIITLACVNNSLYTCKIFARMCSGYSRVETIHLTTLLIQTIYYQHLPLVLLLLHNCTPFIALIFHNFLPCKILQEINYASLVCYNTNWTGIG